MSWHTYTVRYWTKGSGTSFDGYLVRKYRARSADEAIRKLVKEKGADVCIRSVFPLTKETS